MGRVDRCALFGVCEPHRSRAEIRNRVCVITYDDGAGSHDGGDSPAMAHYRNRARCPWCDSTDVRLASLFGGTVSALLFKCQQCQSAFGVMQWATLDPSAIGRASCRARVVQSVSISVGAVSLK